jgi:osmoprotectant transport system ATP-binding protein
MIDIEHLSKRFAESGTPAVDDLSLSIGEGEICVLIGPSGCGKTTTMRMINRMIEPDSGTIRIAGRDVTHIDAVELRRSVGYVIQQVGLFPHMTIAENVATVPQLLGWDAARIASRVDALLAQVDMDPARYRDRYPRELSGGQQQRVGVARALAADPPVLLMDEPYSAVDPIVRARLQDDLLALQERVHKTIVLVTHDIDEAIKLGDQIVLLNIGGVLEQSAPPAELLRHPANEFVARFLGRERALKRMALLSVSDAQLVPGPLVPTSATPEDAKLAMAEYGVDWVGVLDGDTVLGWAWASDVQELARVGDAPLQRFAAWVRPHTGLREALDVIVDSSTRVAIVLDDEDRYLGLLTIEEIADGMAR